MSPERRAAAVKVIIALRDPLLLASRPSREDIVKLAADYDLTAIELIEVVVDRNRNR